MVLAEYKETFRSTGKKLRNRIVTNTKLSLAHHGILLMEFYLPSSMRSQARLVDCNPMQCNAYYAPPIRTEVMDARLGCEKYVCRIMWEYTNCMYTMTVCWQESCIEFGVGPSTALP